MVSITSKDVTDVLRKAVEGKVALHLHPDGKFTWADGIEAPHVPILIDGWKIAIFNDGGQIDYIEFAISPSREALGYEDMRLSNPLSWLSKVELKRLENLLESARWPK